MEVVEVVFCGPNKFSFFACVSGLGSSRRNPRGTGTRNPSKQRVSEQFCVVGPRSLALDPLYRLRVAVQFLTQIFRRLTNLFFSEVRIFDQIGFGRQKKAWGCRTEEIFKMTFFPFFPGGDQFVKFLARFRFYSSIAVWVRFGPLPEICLRLRCGWFFRSFPVLFFRQRFCEFEKGSFENPLSSFRVLLFSAFSSSAWVDATLHVCFGAVGPKPFFSFCSFCLSVYKNTVFPLKKGYFCSFLSVSLSFSLASLTSPFRSLSLSFSCLFFLSFLVLLFLFVTFLVFLLFFLALFLCFCFMTTTTSKY